MSYTYNAKRIRNQLGQYSKPSVLKVVIEYLNKPVASPDEQLRKLPHLSYLLIEWLFQVEEVTNPKVATPKEVHRLLNEMHKLQAQAVNLQPEYNAFLAIRKLIISQLRAQRPLLGQLNGLTRLYILMTESPQSNWFEKDFKGAHGLELKTFLIMCLWLLWKLNQTHTLYYKDILTELYADIPVDQIALFFRVVGIRLGELGRLLSSKKDESIKVDAYFTPTILTCKPLLLLEKGAVVPDSLLLRQSLCDFVLNDFTARDNSAFRDKFTPAFEQYTGCIIDSSRQKFTTERYLNNALHEQGITSKVCDFIIHGEADVVFIDAKGIEPKRVAQASSNPKTLRNQIKSRVSIGTEQCFASAAVCEQHDIIPLPPRNRRFSLVVTHQSFYFLNGLKVQDQIYPDFYSTLAHRYGEVIPLEHIYFVTIEEFEMIMLLVDRHDIQMGDFLDFCVERDGDPTTTVFEIYQHIIAFCEALGIDSAVLFDNSTIESSFNSMVDQLEGYVGRGLSYWKRRGANGLQEFMTSHQYLTALLGVG